MESAQLGIDDHVWAEAELAEVLRLNLGHAAGGKLMTSATVDACLALLAASDLTMVDLHGPPPELHPRFREIVILVRALRRRLIHRCNLAVLGRPDQWDVIELLAAHRVDVVTALPDMTLGPASAHLIGALRRFNLAGYGLPDSNLLLDLVVPIEGEPTRARAAITARMAAHGVRCHGLHLVPARPPSSDLVGDLQRLAAEVDPMRVVDVPCRAILGVDWDGALSARRGGETVRLGRNERDPAAPAGGDPSRAALSAPASDLERIS